MRPRGVLLLVALGVIALAGGWYFGTATTPQEQTTVARGTLMFPALAPKLAGAAKLEITHQGKRTVIEKRPDGAWGVASMHDYPVQDNKLRGVLTGLTELRLAEPRTSDPAQFSRLGVDDPNGAGSTADLLRVLDGAGKPILAVIVGHRRVRGQTDVPDEIYVRRPDQTQSWLAEGSLQVDADPAQWLDRSVMNIGHDRIASVTVDDGALIFARVDGKLALTQPVEHPKLEAYKVGDVGRALELLTFQAVRPQSPEVAPTSDVNRPLEHDGLKANPDAPGTETGHAVFTTKDGLAITVTVFHAAKDVWARFAASASSAKAQTEAGKLNARLAGWTYEIGSWKEKSLVPTIDDLKAEAPAKPAPAPAGK